MGRIRQNLVMNIISTKNVKLNIGKKEILHGLDVEIPKGKITVILGPNGCGKSTTLKALCRLLKYSGSVQFAGQEVADLDGHEFAKRVAILAQNPSAPDDLTVLDLVKMGRFPHRNKWGSGTKDDEKIVDWALKQTNMTVMQERVLNTLSGGERQRAWIAMALAQKPEVLFLDEPTSYLDICHQLEVINLVKDLNKTLGLTIVMVLHDITQALSCGDNFIIIKDGSLVATGDGSIVDTNLLRQVFNVDVDEFNCRNGERALVPVQLSEGVMSNG